MQIGIVRIADDPGGRLGKFDSTNRSFLEPEALADCVIVIG